MLPLNTIKNLMHSATDRAISIEALYELSSYLESQIIKITKIGEEELRKSNESRKIQCLPIKKRLGVECIKNAINNISIASYSHLPDKAGGIKEKEVKRNGTKEIEVV